jgi:hypothetical protein
MELRPTYEAIRLSVTQEFTEIVWNPKVPEPDESSTYHPILFL